MKKLKQNEKGFGVVEGLLLIVFVAVLGFAGWRVYEARKTTPVPAVNITQPKTTATKSTATNPYAGWKTYTLKYEKLTFMYPPTWTVTDQSLAAAKHDEVTLSSADNFSFTINDGIQNGGDPLPLVSSEPISLSYLSSPAYLVFVNPKVVQANGPSAVDSSVVGSAILLTTASNQASLPSDKNVIGSTQYNGVNGPEGSYLLITAGYNGKNNMAIQAAKSDAEYKNAVLVIQSAKY